MVRDRYNQFCPVAMASEVLCTRWTMVLLRELIAGSERFNDLRRGVPRMSPSLLSKRLGELEELGVIYRAPLQDGGRSKQAYRLTEAGRDLSEVIDSIGKWGQKWVEAEPSLENLDPGLLMWDMRRNLDTTPMPDRQVVIEFHYFDQPLERQNWWLIAAPDQETDLCSVDPGFDVDLYVYTDLRCMTAIWMGVTSVSHARQTERMTVDGPADLERSMQCWLGLSPFAQHRKLV